jgi:hypothetical protein
VDEINNQGVIGHPFIWGLLAEPRLMKRAKDGPHVKGLGQRFSWSMEIAPNDQGSHGGSVPAKFRRVLSPYIVWIIHSLPASQGLMLLKGKPIDQGDQWFG